MTNSLHILSVNACILARRVNNGRMTLILTISVAVTKKYA